MAISPTLNQCCLSDRLIALGTAAETQYVSLTSISAIRLLRSIHMAFIRDGANLVYYVSDFGLRIWNITGLIDGHWHTAHGHELEL